MLSVTNQSPVIVSENESDFICYSMQSCLLSASTSVVFSFMSSSTMGLNSPDILNTVPISTSSIICTNLHFPAGTWPKFPSSWSWCTMGFIPGDKGQVQRDNEMREVRCDVMRCDSRGWQGFNPEIVCPSLLLGDVLPSRLHLPSRLSLLSRLSLCRQNSPFSLFFSILASAVDEKSF